MSGIISKRRNELIASVLVSCSVMEAAGTGFDKIIEEYAEADDRHRPYTYSTSDHFTFVLPDMTYTEGIGDSSIPVLSFVPASNGTNFDEKVLEFCYCQARKVSEIAEYLGISDSTYLKSRCWAIWRSRGIWRRTRYRGQCFLRLIHRWLWWIRMWVDTGENILLRWNGVSDSEIIVEGSERINAENYNLSQAIERKQHIIIA